MCGENLDVDVDVDVGLGVVWCGSWLWWSGMGQCVSCMLRLCLSC